VLFAVAEPLVILVTFSIIIAGLITVITITPITFTVLLPVIF